MVPYERMVLYPLAFHLMRISGNLRGSPALNFPMGNLCYSMTIVKVRVPISVSGFFKVVPTMT